MLIRQPATGDGRYVDGKPALGCRHRAGANGVGRIILNHLRHHTTVLQRIAWVLVAAAHVPAFVRAVRSLFTEGVTASGLTGCTVLGLVLAFLALKVAGVGFLRFRTDARSLLAIGLAIGLMHVDVLRPQVDITLIPEYAPIVATTLLAAGLDRLRRVRAALSCRVNPVVNTATAMLRRHEAVWFDAFRPHCWVRATHLFLLRAPPV